MVPTVRPVCEYVVEALAVFATSVSKEPAPFFTSILYPVIAEPPFDGAVHERFTWVADAGVAVRLVEPGAVADVGCEVVVGVADASADATPVPIELIAEIL